jgi:hypothetical protein
VVRMEHQLGGSFVIMLIFLVCLQSKCFPPIKYDSLSQMHFSVLKSKLFFFRMEWLAL